MINILTKTVIETSINKSDFDVIILKVKNLAFATQNPWETKILGKSMISWVQDACEGYNIRQVECDANSDILHIVKSMLTDAAYTIVLFSDTPLLKSKTIGEIASYVAIKQPSVCVLTRGYVFSNSYLRTADKLYTTQPQYFDEEDFITAYNNYQIVLISEILKNRLISFHTKNGVRFVDPTTVYIESGVVVESGTTIWPNNNLVGNCHIGASTTLLPNNYIENSVIGNNCEIISSVVKNANVEDGSYVGPFEKMINK